MEGRGGTQRDRAEGRVKARRVGEGRGTVSPRVLLRLLRSLGVSIARASSGLRYTALRGIHRHLSV